MIFPDLDLTLGKSNLAPQLVVSSFGSIVVSTENSEVGKEKNNLRAHVGRVVTEVVEG